MLTVTALPPPDQLHTTEQAAEVLDVPPGLIRKWAHQGKAMPAGRLPAPVRGGSIPLYHLGELKHLAERYHASALPRVKDGQLTAHCVCGEIRQVPTDTVTNGATCESCGATTGDGLMQGPDRVAIIKLLGGLRGADTNNVVYFARVGNLVKIGTTSNLWQRMSSLGNPELLGVLPGGYRAERQHHRHFAAEHVTGEIFEASDRLLAYIDENCTLPPRPLAEPKHNPSPWRPWKTEQ